jgi:hypothetical protein
MAYEPPAKHSYKKGESMWRCFIGTLVVTWQRHRQVDTP